MRYEKLLSEKVLSAELQTLGVFCRFTCGHFINHSLCSARRASLSAFPLAAAMRDSTSAGTMFACRCRRVAVRGDVTTGAIEQANAQQSTKYRAVTHLFPRFAVRTVYKKPE